MNRRFLLTFSLLSSGLLAAAAGCGDDVDGSGGLGGGTTTTTGTGNGTGTTTTKATSTGTNMTSNSSTGTSMAATCDAYCAAIDANCGEPLAQYASVEACGEICLSFAQGTAPDTAMDTLECRAYHTGAAMGSPDPHCVHAGPLGSGMGAGVGCTSDNATRCTAFCNAALQVCDGNNVVWGTVAECLTDCAQMPDNVDYNTLEAGGDSLACRMYHMTVAADAKVNADMQAFADHCTHIALDSGPCGG
jgi:hypothetical protein